MCQLTIIIAMNANQISSTFSLQFDRYPRHSFLAFIFIFIFLLLLHITFELCRRSYSDKKLKFPHFSVSILYIFFYVLIFFYEGVKKIVKRNGKYKFPFFQHLMLVQLHCMVHFILQKKVKF
jgi:hypothetical protein